MDKRIFLIVLAIISAGLLYKRSAQSMQPSSRSSSSIQPMITLISSDGKQFQISRQAAEYSETLKHVAGDTDTSKGIPLQISSQILAHVVELLNQLPNVVNVDNFVIQKFVRSDGAYSADNLIIIANASLYLQVDELTDALMRLYIFQQLKAHPNMTMNEIMQPLENALLQYSVERLFEFVKSSAGLVALRTPIKEQGFLNLSRKNITNLYGLSLMPDKAAVKIIHLDDNKLVTITRGAFQGFENLETLALYHNQLTDLSDGAFEGFTNMKNLYLQYNKLKTIPSTLFNRLAKLYILSFDHNELTTLPDGLFEGLANLVALYFDNNKLSVLPAGIFKGLLKLENLGFSDNELTALPDELFKGLGALKDLGFSNNKLGALPVRLFQDLVSLKALWINKNPFNPPLTVDQIKLRLPNGGAGVRVVV